MRPMMRNLTHAPGSNPGEGWGCIIGAGLTSLVACQGSCGRIHGGDHINCDTYVTGVWITFEYVGYLGRFGPAAWVNFAYNNTQVYMTSRAVWNDCLLCQRSRRWMGWVKWSRTERGGGRGVTRVAYYYRVKKLWNKIPETYEEEKIASASDNESLLGHTGFDYDIGSLLLAHALAHCVLPIEAAPDERPKVLYLKFVRLATSMSFSWIWELWRFWDTFRCVYCAKTQGWTSWRIL